MYDIHYYECEYCGERFDNETACHRHELNHWYKDAVPTMGRIFIKVDGCDELKEYSAEYPPYNINTIYVNSAQACNFMRDVFYDECTTSPWDGASLTGKSGWYYTDNNDFWHYLRQDIADLLLKEADLNSERLQLEGKES